MSLSLYSYSHHSSSPTPTHLEEIQYQTFKEPTPCFTAHACLQALIIVQLFSPSRNKRPSATPKCLQIWTQSRAPAAIFLNPSFIVFLNTQSLAFVSRSELWAFWMELFHENSSGQTTLNSTKYYQDPPGFCHCHCLASSRFQS